MSPRAFRWSDEQIAQILLEDLDKGPAFGEYGIVRLVLSILWISRRLDGEILLDGETPAKSSASVGGGVLPGAGCYYGGVGGGGSPKQL